MQTELTDTQWSTFEEQGYFRLGSVMGPGELKALQQRLDDIMLGKANIDCSRTLMQLDRDPERTGQPGPQTRGHKGPTLDYRKIQNLEHDAVFLRYLQKPLFRNICARAYGGHRPVARFRAMFMNKPAGKGTPLVWHQDRWTDLDRDPMITIWTALDPATGAYGCVKVVPGSHRSLVNPEHPSGFLNEQQAADLLSSAEPVHLELPAGECMILHNWLLHGSDDNSTAIPRRAFSVCYMDAGTQSKNGHVFPVVFGEGALRPA